MGYGIWVCQKCDIPTWLKIWNTAHKCLGYALPAICHWSWWKLTSLYPVTKTISKGKKLIIRVCWLSPELSVSQSMHSVNNLRTGSRFYWCWCLWYLTQGCIYETQSVFAKWVNHQHGTALRVSLDSLPWKKKVLKLWSHNYIAVAKKSNSSEIPKKWDSLGALGTFVWLDLLQQVWGTVNKGKIRATLRVEPDQSSHI